MRRILITDLRRSTIPWLIFLGFASLYIILLFFATSGQIFRLLIPAYKADDIATFRNFNFREDTTYIFTITLRPRYTDHIVFLGLQNSKGTVFAQSLGYVTELSTVSRTDFVPSRPNVPGCPSFARNDPPPGYYQLVLFYSSNMSLPAKCNTHSVVEPSGEHSSVIETLLFLYVRN